MMPSRVTPEDHVHHWTLHEAVTERAHLIATLENRGLSLADLRTRGDEWELAAEDRDLLRRIERLGRMVTFASSSGGQVAE